MIILDNLPNLRCNNHDSLSVKKDLIFPNYHLLISQLYLTKNLTK